MLEPISMTPYQPLNLTWIITHIETDDVVYQILNLMPKDTWFLDLQVNLDDLFVPREWRLTWVHDPLGRFYVCPGHGLDKACRQKYGVQGGLTISVPPGTASLLDTYGRNPLPHQASPQCLQAPTDMENMGTLLLLSTLVKRGKRQTGE